MERLKKLIKETLKKHYSPKTCDCGCGGCDSKDNSLNPIILHESLNSSQQISENLQYHIKKQKPLSENIFRYGSTAFLNLWSESRKLLKENKIQITNVIDLEILTETDLGEFGIIYEIEIGDKVKASKEYGGLSGEVVDIRGSFIVVKTKEGNQSYHESDLKVLNKEGKKVPLDFPMEEENLTESTKYFTPKVIKDKNNPNFTYINIPYPTGTGFLSALGKQTASGQEREQGVKKALNIGQNIFNKLQNNPNIEDIEITDLKNGIVQIFIVSDTLALSDLSNLTEAKNKLFKKGDIVYDAHTKTKLKVTRIVKDRIYTVPFNFPGRAEEWYKAEDLQTKSFFTESKNENKPLNKPMRDSSGGKAYKVYVRDPKTKKIKTVRFGSGGLRAKLDNPKARKAFAARHKCGQGEEKTSPKWWSCRIGRYSKLLGFKSNFTGFW